MRMNQMIATESKRPVFPPPGLDNMTATTEHSNATTIVAADYPSPTQLSLRRSALPRRCTPSQTSTTVRTAPQVPSTWTRCAIARKNRDLQIPRDQGYRNFWPICRPRRSFVIRWVSEALPQASEYATHVAVDSVNRDNMLDFGRTTCRRIQPEPQPERAGLLLRIWYSLTLDPSGVFVSEAVNDVDDQHEKRSVPRLCNTMTGLVNGPDDRLDTATDVDVFLARRSDEVHPKHLCPDERADFVAAHAAEWKATVDSGSVKVLNPVAADTVRRERPDTVINSGMVRRRKPQEGTFRNQRPCPDGSSWNARTQMLQTCSPTRRHHKRRVSCSPFFYCRCVASLCLRRPQECVLSVQFIGLVRRSAVMLSHARV